MSNEYAVRVYVEHGFYEYTVEGRGRAIEHAMTIMSSGVYRRYGENSMEFYPCYKVKVIGPDLESNFTDRFCRT